MRAMLAIILSFAVLAGPVGAQTELSFYGGVQRAASSQISGSDPGGAGAFDFAANWQGRSFTAPPYFGVRLTWWQNNDWAWGLDFSRDKIYADAGTLTSNALSALNFGDGLNILTVNRFRQWNELGGNFVPYVGAGVGISLPRVEFDSGAGTTSEYQFGGPAVAIIAGARYPLNDRWSVFGEYKGTYSVNNLELVSGGDLNANIFTNSLNLGAVLGF